MLFEKSYEALLGLTGEDFKKVQRMFIHEIRKFVKNKQNSLERNRSEKTKNGLMC